MRAIVVVPTFNERDSLETLIGRIRQAVPGMHVLIVDDNSPDGTGQLAEDLSRKYEQEVFVLHRTQKEGLGKAYVAGFRYVLDRGYEIVLQMDADLSHDPAYLPDFLREIRDCDLVLGSRYMHGVNVINWELKRILLSKMATRYAQIITGMPFSDATGGFKCWRRKTLESVRLDRVFASGYLFQIETTFRAFRSGLGIREIPIIFHERKVGCSKMNWRIIWEAVWGVVMVRIRG